MSILKTDSRMDNDKKEFDLQEYLTRGAMKMGRFGDAVCRLCDAVKTADIALEWLEKDIDVFGNADPLKK